MCARPSRTRTSSRTWTCEGTGTVSTSPSCRAPSAQDVNNTRAIEINYTQATPAGTVETHDDLGAADGKTPALVTDPNLNVDTRLADVCSRSIDAEQPTSYAGHWTALGRSRSTISFVASPS